MEHLTRRPPWRLVLGAALAFALGWAASAAWSSGGALSLVEELKGTVAVANEDGSKVCLEPDRGGPPRCGVLFQRTEASPLSVGDHVSIAVGRLRLADGSEQEIFVLDSFD